MRAQMRNKIFIFAGLSHVLQVGSPDTNGWLWELCRSCMTQRQLPIKTKRNNNGTSASLAKIVFGNLIYSKCGWPGNVISAGGNTVLAVALGWL